MPNETKPYELHAGDARHIVARDESVQCVVTSPPYWGLRKYDGEQESIWLPAEHPKESDFAAMCPHEWAEKTETVEMRQGAGLVELGKRYRGGGHAQNELAEPFTVTRGTCQRCGAWRGAFGLEPTIEMYMAHSLEILRECRRVLRPDGVLFWNVGDSYAGGHAMQETKRWQHGGKSRTDCAPLGKMDSLKPKDLCLIPARIALAAQADGWYVRSIIVWAKPNPMPESVTDRPTDAYEHIIMLTKAARYFWDADAVREPAATGWNGSSFTDERDRRVYPNLGTGRRNEFGYAPKGTHSRGTGAGGPKAQARGTYSGWAESTREILSSRNMRNVWMFATQPYPEAHFATFPEELPRRCILAATSTKGACSSCGAPWERVTRSTVRFESGSGKSGHVPSGKNGAAYEQAVSGDYDIRMGPALTTETIGWRPTCLCRGQRGKTVSCVVLDPFTGSGTTGKVAMQLGRRYIGMDLAYHELSRERIESGIPGSVAWNREKNSVRLNRAADLPLFQENADAAE